MPEQGFIKLIDNHYNSIASCSMQLLLQGNASMQYLNQINTAPCYSEKVEFANLQSINRIIDCMFA